MNRKILHLACVALLASGIFNAVGYSSMLDYFALDPQYMSECGAEIIRNHLNGNNTTQESEESDETFEHNTAQNSVPDSKNAYEAAMDRDYRKTVEFINDDNFDPNILYNSESGKESEFGYTLLGNGIINSFDSDEICNLIDLLSQKGANLNLQDCEGDTPLHHAIKTSYINVAKKLINLGADTSITNHRGESPIEAARNKGGSFYNEIYYTINRKKILTTRLVTGLSSIAGGAVFYSLYNYPKIAKLIGSLEIALFKYNCFYKPSPYPENIIPILTGALLGRMFIGESLRYKILLSIFGAATSGVCGFSFVDTTINYNDRDFIAAAEGISLGLILTKNIFVFVYRLNRILSQFEKLEKLLEIQ